MNTRLQVQRKTTPTPSFTPVGRNLLPQRSTEQAEPPLVPPILHDMLPKFQAKLTVGQPNDKYEQEADRVADQVMRMPEPKIQRVCPECEEELQRQPMEEEEEEETLQTKPLVEQITPLVQREAEPMEEEEEEETLQTKTRSGQLPTVSSSLQNRITALRGGGQPLPQSERTFFEPRFGANFSQVRVHTDSQAAETAQSVNARAFTLGRDIVFGAGQYVPGTNEGKHLIAHELTHVVQQSGAEGIGSRKMGEQGNSGTIMPYRSKNSPNFGANDSGTMKEKPYKAKKGYPIIKLIEVQFNSVKTIDGESVPSGTLTASYMNIRGAKKPSNFSAPVVGGYPSQGLSDKVTKVTPDKIKGWGYNRSTVERSKRSPKDSHYYQPRYARSANMSWAIYFRKKQAVHFGPLDAGSLACIHVADESKMRRLNYHTLPYENGTKITVDYTQEALKKPCCERYKAIGKMVNNPCGSQKASDCP